MSTQSQSMNAHWLDHVVLLWIMPPLGFLMTVLQVSEFRMLIENHVVVVMLVGTVLFRCMLRPVVRSTALHLMLAAILMVAFTGVEWLHFLAGRQSLDGLTDVRMILYSPFYGSMIVFLLYATYITTLDDEERVRHLRHFARFMCWFHLGFLGYWILLYSGWIAAIPRTDLLHSNAVAYGALFVLCVMLFYGRSIAFSKREFAFFLVTNVTVILANGTRGAIIALAAMTTALFARRLVGRARADWMPVLLIAMIVGSLAIAIKGEELLTQVLGRNADSLGLVLDRVRDAHERGEVLVTVSSSLVDDEGSLSAFSRIGSNYYSLLSFLDNPLLGIGQVASYSIKVIGSGVHSLHFLVANSTGLVGWALLGGTLIALLAAQQRIVVSGRLAVMSFLFLGYVLFFVNSMPVYFSLIITLLADRGLLAAAPGKDLLRSSGLEGRVTLAGGH